MKHMNYNAAENQPHKYARPVTLDEMNRMPGQEEYERRTRTSKVFSLGRGLYQAVMYPEAVHFRDKNSGKLEEIDNTLMPIQDSACGVYLTNRNNDELKVEFHGAHDAAMVLLRNEDDCYLGWKLDGAQDVQPKVVDFARPQESKRDCRRAVLAQLGVPDMRVPIAYAMTYPRRIPTGSKPLDLFSIGTLTFEPGDPVRFPALRLAGECLNAGGAACTILNGANEMAVAAFLRDEIPFGAISRIVEGTLEACGAMPADTLDDIFHADLEARRVAKEIAEKLK